MINSMAEYVESTNALSALVDSFDSTIKTPITNEFNQALITAWKQMFPRKRKLPTIFSCKDPIAYYKIQEQLGEEIRIPIITKYQQIVKEKMAEYNSKVDALKKDIKQFNETYVIAPNDILSSAQKSEWTKRYICSNATYHTQGFGADTYAHDSAQQTASTFIHFGIPAEIVCETEKPELRYYYVLAACNKYVYNIIETRSIPLKDWIKGCWKRGVNPRVYSPFLPYGLEKELGLDYFGNEVPEPEVKEIKHES